MSQQRGTRVNFRARIAFSTRVLALVGMTMILSSAAAYWSGSALLSTGAQLTLMDGETSALVAGRDGLVLWRKERQAWVEHSLAICRQRGQWPVCLPPAATAKGTATTDKPDGWLDDNHFLFRPNLAQPQTVYDIQLNWEPIKPRFAELSAALRTSAHLESLWAPLLQSLKMVFGATLVVAGGAALFVLWLLTRGYTRRIVDLTRYARRLAVGDLRCDPPARRRDDELGLLAETMANMAQSLAVATDRLVYQEKMASWQLVARKMAHEIKNPLTPICLVGEQLQRYLLRAPPDLAAALAEASRVLREETSFLTRMVREFSHFARLPEVQVMPCNLAELVTEFIGREAVIQSARFEFVAPLTPVAVAADRAMIVQILRNLLNNAVRAKAPEKVTIRILLTATAAGWTLLFSDDGPGVPEGMRERIFDAYVTTRSTGEAEKGMGLGLTIARKIAAEHGGSLILCETLVGGACFALELPVI